MSKSPQDTLFSTPLNEIVDFVFDDKVVDVFPDMINRSVPGYSAIINLIGIIAEQYAKPNGDVVLRQSNSHVDPIMLEIVNQRVKKGDIVEIDFTSQNLSGVIGFQFTLQMDGLKGLNIYPGKINITPDQIAIHKNALTCSWFNLNTISANKADVLFTLIARAYSDGQLSEMLNINSSITPVESYKQIGKDELLSGIKLNIGGNPKLDLNEDRSLPYGEGLTLHQNEPNPFKSETTIPFSISESGKVSLWIFNALGREVYFSSRNFPAGRNAFRVNFSSIELPGLMYYRVEKDGVVATRKMVYNGGSRN